MPVELVSDTFAGRVGESFTIAPANGEPIETVLSECEEKPASQAPGGKMPFSLVLHAEGPGYYGQQMFTVGHSELGEFSLFLVPLGPDERGMAYQAVIG
jgi:hypothetical protein